MTASTALIGDIYSGSERDRFMGLQTAFVGFGGLIFMTGGGLLAEASWRAPFAIYGLAFAVQPAVMLYLPEPKRSGPANVGEQTAHFPWLAVAALFLAAAFNSVIFHLIPTQLPFHLMSLGAESPGIIGLILGVFNLSLEIGSLGYGRVRERIGLPGPSGLASA